jgi:hypothetical protein
MNPSDLVFLEKREAQLLAAAWPHLKKPRTEERWQRLAGVDEYEAESLCLILRESEICKEDGTTDPLALAFIASRMTRGLPKKKKAPDSE